MNTVSSGTGFFRTHIGSSTTKLDAQVYDSADSMEHFGRFASIYAQLYSYRKVLMQEAVDTGHPLIRYAFVLNVKSIWKLFNYD